jgi:hypothetical protein
MESVEALRAMIFRVNVSRNSGWHARSEKRKRMAARKIERLETRIAQLSP